MSTQVVNDQIVSLAASKLTGTVSVTNGGTGASLAATGGASQVLKQVSVGAAITVGVMAGSDITGAALTKVDDTNVTLTLGGTPTTALLRAASLTLGWTGLLGVARGGTGASTFTAGSVIFAGPSGVYAQDNAKFFWDDTNNRLGVGTATPAAVLDVSAAQPTTGLGVLNLYTVPNSTQINTFGGSAEIDLTSNAAVSPNAQNQYSALSVTTRHRGDASLSNANARDVQGIFNSVFNFNTGTTGWISGFYTDMRNLSTGIVTNMAVYRVVAALNSGGGTITNLYGLYIPTLAASGITNPWGIFQAGTDSNSFSGNILIGTTTKPTTGTGAIVFGDGTALASMGANTCGLYGDDVGGTVESFAINESGERAQITGNMCRNSSQFDATTTTLGTVTGLSRNVLAGTVYRFEALLYITANVTGGSKYAIAGTATATAITYFITLLDENTDGFTIMAKQTAMGGSTGQAGTTSGLCRLTGTINVNAGGTLLVQFAQNVASGTSSVLVNSTFAVQQVS